jgi:probable HAF family extracellular repeat protein
VVGASRTGATGAPTAFRWKNGTLTSLGVLSGGESVAYASSSDGAVVVGDARLSATQTVGFRWSSNNIEALELASYGTYSTARDISDDGSVIVGWGDRDLEQRALVWTNLVVATRGSIDPLYFNAVTPSGSIYAGKMVSAPMVYESSSTELGLLNGYTGGEVLALTQSGSTRGVGYLNGGSNERAVRWTLGGDAVDLGTLAGASRALGISADGTTIVGTSNNQAFIWDSDNGMRALETVLSDAGVDLDGWALQSATGVSADGETVVGNGTHGSVTEAFRAVLP